MTTAQSFNLIDEPWIPVLRLSGQTGRVGVRVALTEAGRIRQLAASNPMDNVALLRFLLAVLYWCKGNPPAREDQQRILANNPFPSEWFSKLEEHRESFNLLGSGCRFCQDDAKRDQEGKHTANYLLHEVPTGTNPWHFRHSTDCVEGLCPACCAIGLVRLPTFATSGGRGKSPGLNSKPPLYILPWGDSLASTLLLSWRTTESELGTPAWEMPGDALPETGVVPLLNGLTWIPRSVWLANPEEPKSVCISCGRKDRLIYKCVFAGKGSSKAEGRVWRDPHVIYDDDAKTGEPKPHPTSDALKSPAAAAGHWARDLAAILQARPLGGDAKLRIVGFSTVQNDKHLEVTERLLPPLGSGQQEDEPVAFLEQWEKRGAGLRHRLRPKRSFAGKHPEIRSVVDAIRPHVEAQVFAAIGGLLSGGSGAWERARQEYRPLVGVVANSLSPGFTTQALIRRRDIARTFQNIRPTPSAKAHKPKNKKDDQ